VNEAAEPGHQQCHHSLNQAAEGQNALMKKRYDVIVPVNLPSSDYELRQATAEATAEATSQLWMSLCEAKQ
jgi:hypothetical protein